MTWEEIGEGVVFEVMNEVVFEVAIEIVNEVEGWKGSVFDICGVSKQVVIAGA